MVAVVLSPPQCVNIFWVFTIIIIRHRQSGVVYNFGRICMYVCMSNDNFRKTSHRKFVFAHPVYLEAVWVHLVAGSHFRSCKKDGGHAI